MHFTTMQPEIIFCVIEGVSMRRLLLLISTLCSFPLMGQNLDIEDFKNHHVLYGDIGASPAPFVWGYPFGQNTEKLVYKNNYKPILGLGYAFRWFSLRVALPILPGLRKEKYFGQSEQYSLGFDYSFRSFYTDVDLRFVKGYALKDGASFDTLGTSNSPHLILPGVGTLNMSLNLWYFRDNAFKMNALQGKRAHFEKEVHTWYLKNTVNVFGVANEHGSLIPESLQDPTRNITRSSQLTALDFGCLPGYAYANRINNWQFSGWAGIGPVIQAKFFTSTSGTNGFLGLAPRYDVRFVGGYSSTQHFLLLSATFDNKSIRFNPLEYKQYFYTLRLIGGIRIPAKKVPLKPPNRPNSAKSPLI